MPRQFIAPSLAALVLAACVATPMTPSEPVRAIDTPDAVDANEPAAPTFHGDLRWSPADGWMTCPRIEFEAMIAFQLAAPPSSLTDDAQAVLLFTPPISLNQVASEPGDAEIQMRIVLILAACRTQDADGILLDMLTARTPIPTRHADAAHVVAAAHLAASAVPSAPDTLVALATGAYPHPDLEVRTECARSALAHGRIEVVPALLAITRLGTPQGIERDGDWHTGQLTTWARNRAAEALAEYAGIPCPYRGDASIQQREEASLALEAALQGFLPASPATILPMRGFQDRLGRF
ncbi:MAG: hypothetical protein ACI84E_000688 [Planctomycetota bacterium]|jgi:hypothetical protein